MSYSKYGWIALAILVAAAATPARADDLSCVITALAFDDNLNPLEVQGLAAGPVAEKNPVKACSKDKLIPIAAAQEACEKNPDARFVALFRRIAGIDLVKSKDSKAKFNENKPTAEVATIKMKSCEHWRNQSR